MNLSFQWRTDLSEKLWLIALILCTVVGCAIQPSLRKPPVTESVQEVVYAPSKPSAERDPFEGVAEIIRSRALAAERNRQFPKALFYWKMANGLEPQDRDTIEKMKALEHHVQTQAERHFTRGLERFQKNAFQEARKEFLLCLTYQPQHPRAIEYLRFRFNGPEWLAYETREGDTLKKISQDFYHDPDKDFLIAFFNDLEDKHPLKPGLTIKLPVITSIGVAKRGYPGEEAYKPNRTHQSRKPNIQWLEQAEIHYAKGVKHFLSEELEKAMVEWEETLRLNPEHPMAKRDLEKARRLLKNLKKSP